MLKSWVDLISLFWDVWDGQMQLGRIGARAGDTWL